ncbi:DNA-binding transcriptional regulator, GntR family [Sporolituus thermophilus DSM 23256]|uniref:DNA-binding transcriptional regulator, GntR family n=1 Tax=Sporolituus thermophilus DSM 23256 TaxID=1123285 RepID=A0A1G7HHP8_9FIRM|nr:DNA-binding transcriptional regulator, GntR family [Sporolituus thermophilus DSM 23256]
MNTMHYPTQTLVDVAYKALKKDITERVLLPGQKIVIRELHERYGISETPIKQALNRMITEGLVESIPRKGIKVRDINWDDIAELLDIRLMIETYYVKQIMHTFKHDATIKEKFINNLNEHMRIIEHAVDLNDYFQNYYLDQEFHQLFVNCSGNKRLMRIYSNLGTHYYAYYIYGRQSKEETIAGVKEHEAIFHALVAQDEDQVRKCVETHIINAKNKIYRNLPKD